MRSNIVAFYCHRVVETKAVPFPLCNRCASIILFACPIEYLHRQKFVSDPIRFRPLAVKRNLVNRFTRVAVHVRDPDTRSFIFLISVAHKLIHPLPPNVGANVIRSLHPLWRDAWTKTRYGGRSRGRKPSSIVLRNERNGTVSHVKKKTREKKTRKTRKKL